MGARVFSQREKRGANVLRKDYKSVKKKYMAKLMQQPDLPGFIADYPDRVEAVAEERACKQLRTSPSRKLMPQVSACASSLTEYNHKGKWLVGVRFNCRRVKRDELLPVTPATETEQEDEQLMTAFPEEFEKYKAEELAKLMQQPDLLSFIADYPDRVEAVAEERACKQLRTAHPDLFKAKTK